MPRNLREFQSFVLRYERIISPVTLLIGFTIDSLTLRRVDLLPETLLLYVYLTVCGLSILAIHLEKSAKIKDGIADFVRSFAPVTLQFAIGGMFSAFLIFYSMSGALVRSWPFIIVLAFVLVGSELFRRYHTRLVFELSIFYLAVFSFAIFSVPLFMNDIGALQFLIAGGVSLAFITAFSLMLFVLGSHRFLSSSRHAALSIGAIYLVMNGLYFTNILPPIPLALKDIGVYLNVEARSGEYYLTGEARPWYHSLIRDEIIVPQGGRVFVFSSVFAPVDFETSIVHRWEKRVQFGYEDTGTVSFPVSGGRNEGFRGYSYKELVEPGLWRVSVETESGALIGRISFVVQHGPTRYQIETQAAR